MLTLIFALMMTAAETPDLTWYEHYEKGLRHIEEGDAAAAREQLSEALAKRAAEGLQVPVRSGQYIYYTPNLYLAVASQMLGRVDDARKYLKEAERSGIAQKSDHARPILFAYQQLLRGNLSTAADRPGFAVYPRRAPLLTDLEYEKLKADVMAHCNVPPDSSLQDAPWYAHYELGLEVARRGDNQRALPHFLEAIERRPDPQRRARMYGMWLIDYYPYFNLARSHSRLGNYECARDALEISAKVKEISPDSPEYAEFYALKNEAERKTKN